MERIDNDAIGSSCGVQRVPTCSGIGEEVASPGDRQLVPAYCAVDAGYNIGEDLQIIVDDAITSVGVGSGKHKQQIVLIGNKRPVSEMSGQLVLAAGIPDCVVCGVVDRKVHGHHAIAIVSVCANMTGGIVSR